MSEEQLKAELKRIEDHILEVVGTSWAEGPLWNPKLKHITNCHALHRPDALISIVPGQREVFNFHFVQRV